MLPCSLWNDYKDIYRATGILRARGFRFRVQGSDTIGNANGPKTQDPKRQTPNTNFTDETRARARVNMAQARLKRRKRYAEAKFTVHDLELAAVTNFISDVELMGLGFRV